MTFNPDVVIERGVDIHTLFNLSDQKKCTQIYDNFLIFLTENKIPFAHNRVFEKPVGPWPTPMWQVELKGDNFYFDLGKAISWLCLNRGAFSVMVHPNSNDGLLDHTERTLWLGRSYQLKTEIFS